MTRQTRYTNNMFNYLLVGCLFQVSVSLAAPSTKVLTKRAVETGTGVSVSTSGTGTSGFSGDVPDDLNGMVTTMVDGATSTLGDASGRLTNAIGEFGNHVTTFLRNSASSGLNLGSGSVDTMQQMINAGTRTTQSLGKMFNRLFSGVTSVVSSGGTSGYGSGASGYGSGASGYGSGTSGYGSGTSAFGSGTSAFGSGTSGSGSGSLALGGGNTASASFG